jgi:4-aminobutyrate--pyruvate transaminase
MVSLPNSSAARDAASLVHGFSNLAEHRRDGARTITEGKGVYVLDDSGRRYIEAAGGMWCTSLGFGEEELIEAAVEQMRKLPYYHTVAGKSVNPAIDLAEKLVAMAPIPNARVYLALSGSEANDNLVKFIRYYNNALGRPAKKKIISRLNGYHGSTLAAGSLTGIPLQHRAFDLPLPGFLHTDDPHYYRNALPGEDESAFVARMAGNLEALILAEGPDTVAAFIAEPVTGAGGVIIPPEGYYPAIQAVLANYDVLFLADEVITGFCRTGCMFGCETVGIRPDTMTLAKGLSSAYQPIAALILSDDIYRGLELGSDTIGYFAHGTTYSGHPVAAAVALRTIEIMRRRDILGHVQTVSRRFAERLRRLRDHPLVGEVRVVGLMGAVEFVADRATGRRFDPVGSMARMVRNRAEELGMIARQIGGSDTIAFAPPLIITEAEIDAVFDIFDQALGEGLDWANGAGLLAA